MSLAHSGFSCCLQTMFPFDVVKYIIIEYLSIDQQTQRNRLECTLNLINNEMPQHSQCVTCNRPFWDMYGRSDLSYGQSCCEQCFSQCEFCGHHIGPSETADLEDRCTGKRLLLNGTYHRHCIDAAWNVYLDIHKCKGAY
jgi:hypothetical protein